MSNNYIQFTSLFQEIDELQYNYINTLFEDASDQELHSIFDKFNQHKDEHKNAGFNIFNVLSDKYYYENLHSDVISIFLERNGKHNEGNRFLKIFLELLQNIKPELEINQEDFMDSSIFREKHHIDILIQDERTKKAIIIENKINNASDTERQLPTYVEKIGLNNVIAIIYLPLEPNKKPDITDWTTNEIQFINSKLICLPAFNRTDNDFYNGWLLRCIDEAEQNDAKTILTQYSKLILKIGGFIMDKQLYELFYNKVMSQNDIFKSSLSIKEFLDNLHVYRIQRIYDVFIKDCSPFKTINHADDYLLIEGFEFEGRSFKIHLNCLIDKYELKFWDMHYDEIIDGEQVNMKYTSKIISKLNDIKFQETRVDECVQWFSFPEEEKNLYEFINTFRNELKIIS